MYWCLLLGVLAVAWGDDDSTCSAEELADGGCKAEAGAKRVAYPWPNVRGLAGEYGVSNITVPKDLSKPSWRWHHHSGQYGTTIVGGPVIDHEKNLYFTEMTAVHKISPDGQIIWSQPPPPGSHFPDGPSIHAGAVFQSTTTGSLCKFPMSGGAPQWCRKYYPETGADSKYVTSHDGVVIIGTDPPPDGGSGGSTHVLGIDTESGEKLWDFQPDTPTWNNMGMFTHDDSVVLQDWDGKVYRLGLHNGTLLWKSGGRLGKSWTDGGTIIGANGIVYAVHSKANSSQASATPSPGGGVVAHRLSDGQVLWQQDQPHGVFTWPVVGQLHSDDRWTVIVASGSIPPCMPFIGLLYAASMEFRNLAVIIWLLYEVFLVLRHRGCKGRRCCWRGLWRLAIFLALGFVGAYLTAVSLTSSVGPFAFTINAYDADTGELRWRLDLPEWHSSAARGDNEGALHRMNQPWRRVCCPASFGSPSVDGHGTVYIGHVSGWFLGIKDQNEDGKIEEWEIQSFDAEAAFLHSGPAFAPGIFAFSTCDSIWAWKV